MAYSMIRIARQPIIARVMRELSYGQELGEGLRRMVTVMESSGRLLPVVQQTDGVTQVTLLGEVIGPEELVGLTVAARDLFQQISLAGGSSAGELVRLSGYSRPVVLCNLRLLEAIGLVRCVSNPPNDPRAYWTHRATWMSVAGLVQSELYLL